MAALTLPWTISNGDSLDATKVMGNFTSIATWANSDLVRADGGVAMTAQLSLVGDPVNAAHAARKAYVDAKFPVVNADIGAGAVSADKLKQTGGSEAVITAAIRDGAVTTVKLDQSAGAQAVTTATLRNAAVTADKLAPDAVETAKIKNGAVTKDKIDDAAVDHVKRKRGAVYTREAANAQTVNNNITEKLLFGGSAESDTFTGGVTASGTGNFTLPSTYTGDYSVMVRLSSLSGTWNSDKVKLVIYNGDRAYRFVCNDSEGGTYGGVFQLTANSAFYVQLVNDGTGGQIGAVARLEVRQVS